MTDDEKKAAIEAICPWVWDYSVANAEAAVEALLALGWTPPCTYLTGWLAGREDAAKVADQYRAEVHAMAMGSPLSDHYLAGEGTAARLIAERIRAIPAPGKGEAE